MKRSVLVLLSMLGVILGGCAEAVIPGNGSTKGYIVIVAPATAALPGTTAQQFTAKTNDGSRPNLNWFVNGVAGGNASLGMISSTGMYTAPEFPPAPNSITVSAIDDVDPTKGGSSAVTLENPIPILSSVSPMVIDVGAFTLTITGAHFAPGAVVNFGGTALNTTVISSTQLTATGTVTSAQAGNINITAQNPAPGSNVSAPIVVQVKGVVVQVSPATGLLRAGTQQVFAATVTGTATRR